MMSNNHFFASNAFGWGVGKTRDEAIKESIKAVGNTLTKEQIKAAHQNGRAGFYVWSCEVLAPIETKYEKNLFLSPRGVEIANGKHHEITYLTAKKCAYTTHNGYK